MSHSESLTIKGLLLALLALLNISAETAGFMLGIVLLDSLFGVGRAWKLKRPLRFSVFLWGTNEPDGKYESGGVIGKISILFIPILMALLGKALDHNLNWIVDAFIYIIVVNDAISILSHIGTIKTGKEFEKGDLLALAISKLAEFLSSKIKQVITLFSKNES